jgi:FtsP/CotA-like multicopper oxidase with cupredoxin domain
VTATHPHPPSVPTSAAPAHADDLPVIPRGPKPRRSHFEAFACDPRDADPETPDRVEPNVRVVREVHTGAPVRMPDGRTVDFWSFADPADRRNRRPFPAPLIRVREGQVVHTRLIASTNTHTIHHHGIEPAPRDDGVGHTSFEVSDLYDYQWRPAHSGLFFYHCHKNTVLHFELGMYGPLIVDPPEGEGYVRHGREVVPYDHEVLWIVDDVDPTWHSHLNHSAGMACPADGSRPMLHFRPEYWLINGVPHPETRHHPAVAPTVAVGERVLIRLLNAAYGPAVVRLPFPATCIGMDGHTLGGPGVDRYSRPVTVPAGEPLELSTAQRWDLLVVPDRTGSFTVPMDVRHWVRGHARGRAETTLTVTA